MFLTLIVPSEKSFISPDIVSIYSTTQIGNSDSLNKKVAESYGVNSFSKVKSISYTFNVKFNGKEFNRKWKWNPDTKDVTYSGKDSTGKDVTLNYNRNKPMNGNIKKIDAAFINDNYWLLFPFHLLWDTNVKFTNEGMQKYPIGKGEGLCLDVKYIGNVGYTPGDEFKLYLDNNYKIREWIYLKGGSTAHPSPATWEGNKDFGGITISTLHNGPGGKFKLWFSDVKVEFK